MIELASLEVDEPRPSCRLCLLILENVFATNSTDLSCLRCESRPACVSNSPSSLLCDKVSSNRRFQARNKAPSPDANTSSIGDPPLEVGLAALPTSSDLSFCPFYEIRDFLFTMLSPESTFAGTFRKYYEKLVDAAVERKP